MNKAKGLFVGLCGMDVVFYENQPLPPEDAKMKVNDVRVCIGGPAANAAITFSMLGGQSTVISYIGNSAVGKIVKQEMQDRNIRVIDLCADEDVKCVSGIYVNTDAATRTIFSGRNPIHQLQEISCVEKAVQDADFVLYDGHFSHIDSILLEAVRAQNKELVIDVGGWKDTFEQILRYDPLLICSAVFTHEGKNGIEMMDVYGYRNAAITRGAKPVLYKTGDMRQAAEIPVPQVHAVDTLGAGDVYHGAFCYFRYCQGQSFAQALQSACQVAAASATVFGVVPGVQAYLDQKCD